MCVELREQACLACVSKLLLLTPPPPVKVKVKVIITAWHRPRELVVTQVNEREIGSSAQALSRQSASEGVI